MNYDIAVAREGLNIDPGMLHERASWHTTWRLDKYVGDFAAHVAEGMARLRDAGAEDIEAARVYLTRDWHENQRPYETLVVEGNLLVTAGINALMGLLGNTVPAVVPFDAADARLGVGNANTAESIAQTQLLGGSTLLKAMNSPYPIVGTVAVPLATVTFQATFAAAEANWTWLEIGTFNGAAMGGSTIMLNRKVPVGGLGTKASGASWTLTETITIS